MAQGGLAPPGPNKTGDGCLDASSVSATHGESAIYVQNLSRSASRSTKSKSIDLSVACRFATL
jgi:hypothetical protein